MSASDRQHKVLRIGIIQNNRIIEEHIIPRGKNVTIGDGRKNRIVLHSLGLPTSFPLLVYKNHRYILSFTNDMNGKLSLDGGDVKDFAEIRREVKPRKDGIYQVPLNEKMRGKVTIRGTTILFQFVPPLAGAVRGSGREFRASLLKTLDSTYFGIIVMSAALHAVILLYAMSLPAPEEMTIDTIPDEFVHILIPAKPVETVASETEGSKEDEADKEEPKKDKKPKDQASSSTPKKAPKKTIEQRRKDLQNRGILKILGAKGGKGARGLAAGLITDTDDSGDFDNLLQRSDGILIASADGGAGLKGNAGDTELNNVEGPAGTGKGRVVKTKSRKSVKPNLSVGGDTEVVGTMDRRSLDQVINRQMGRVTACYEKALKLNPSLKGKIYVDLEVAETGKVSRIDIKSVGFSDPAMESCVRSRIRRWKLPKPDGGPADVSFSFVLTSVEG